MAGLQISGVSKAFSGTRVLNDVTLDVFNGEFLTLVGGSGCGKSTLLRVIAGLEPQDAGSVSIGGRQVDHLRPKQRNVAMVFQSYALYPHMTVAQNISMPLVMARLRLAERLPLLGLLSPRRRAVLRAIGAEVEATARQLHIEALLSRKPAQLSGGQRQRVALGRAMVRQPDVFLMDEPLSNLDAKLRVHMRAELADLHRRLGATFVYVTHDQVEAMTMSDRVALMDEGRIIQLGRPEELYHDPVDLRVARFIGSPAMNVLSARAAVSGVEASGALLPLVVDVAAGSAVQLGLRPETLTLEPAPGAPTVAARLTTVENLGAEAILHFETIAEPASPLVARVSLEPWLRARASGRLAGVVRLGVDPARALVFDGAGRRIPAAPMGAGADALVAGAA